MKFNPKDLIKGKKLYVQHRADEKPVLAVNYLKSIGLAKKDLGQIFDNAGNWKYQITDEVDPFSLSLSDLKNLLLENLEIVYKFVSPSLDRKFKYGFNRHDIEHIEDVTGEVKKILKWKKSDKKQVAIGIIAAASHDLGNLLSRSYHAHLSPYLLRLIFPNLKIKNKDWERIKLAINNHELGVLEKTIDWQKSSEKIIKELKSKFLPEALALILADKTRYGRNRISDKPKSPKAIDADIHLEVNLLGRTEKLKYSGTNFTWQLKYFAFATEDEVSQRPHLFRPKSTGPGFKASVSKETQNRYRLEIPVDHFSTWRQKFWNVYLKRNMMAIYSAFALFPKLNTFTVKMVDLVNPDSNLSETVIYKTRKENLKEFEKFLKVKYTSKKIRKNA